MLNIDQTELAKFEALASRWWDKEGECKPLHQMNPVRMAYIDEKINVAEKNVLDVGCGGGILCEAMAQRGAIVTGIDASKAPLTVAGLHQLESQLDITYQQATAEEFARDNEHQFHVVSCLEMLEHVPDPASVINACSQLILPGGHVFFSTINRNLKAYAFAVLGAEYILKLLPKGTHDYAKFIKPSEISRWIRQSGLEIKDICGILYNPVNQKFHLSRNDVDVNYLVHCIKPKYCMKPE